MQYISTPNAPAPLGPYAQATLYNGLIHVAMQIAVLPDGTHQTELPLPEQARQVLENIRQILLAAGSDSSHCLKVSLFTTDLSFGAAVNQIYEEFFPGPNRPARTVIEVKALPLGYKIAAEAVGAVIR